MTSSCRAPLALSAFTGLTIILSAGEIAAQEADSSTSAHQVVSSQCSPWKACAFGVVIPGGGQFYLGDVSGGIQAVATDLILFAALRRSGATGQGIAYFLVPVHIIEGLFAAQACRTMKAGKPSPVPSATPPTDTASRTSRGWQPVPGELRTASSGDWCVMMSIRLPLNGS